MVAVTTREGRQGYAPGLRVTERAIIARRRHLPLPGTIHVSVGEDVDAATLVASTELPGNVFNINVANELSCQPEELLGHMLVTEGDEVEIGQIVGESKAFWGIFHSFARAPVGGTVETVSDITGQVLIRGEPIRVQMDAYVDGTVVDIEGHEAVTVQTHAALVQGILGVDGEAHGELMMVANSPTQRLAAEGIDDSCAGKILVGGSLVSLDALRRCVEVGVAGVVVGGINDADLDEFLGYPLGVAITGQESLGTTLMLTEGFGEIPMAARAFEILKSRAGQRASINGTTQIRAGVMRPEVIIPEPGATWQSDDDETMTGLQVGSEVRVIRDPLFGRLATVTELPEQLEQIATEAQVRVVRVKLDDTGEVETVPRANVEVIQR